jgi:hypothetical protein
LTRRPPDHDVDRRKAVNVLDPRLRKVDPPEVDGVCMRGVPFTFDSEDRREATTVDEAACQPAAPSE